MSGKTLISAHFLWPGFQAAQWRWARVGRPHCRWRSWRGDRWSQRRILQRSACRFQGSCRRGQTIWHRAFAVLARSGLVVSRSGEASEQNSKMFSFGGWRRNKGYAVIRQVEISHKLITFCLWSVWDRAPLTSEFMIVHSYLYMPRHTGTLVECMFQRTK